MPTPSSKKLKDWCPRSRGALAAIVLLGSAARSALAEDSVAPVTGQQGWAVLQGVGIEALLGFLGSYLNVRVVAPLIAESLTILTREEN